MGLVIIYLLTSWLPTLMRETGATMERAAFIGGLFQFGGVLNALFVGWAMDRLIQTVSLLGSILQRVFSLLS